MRNHSKYLKYVGVIFVLLFMTVPALAVTGPTGEGGEGTWSGLIFYITVALGFSFLCSVLEAVLLSTSVSYVELNAEEGKRSGKLMQQHKENVERPISAILTLNTIAHTVGAAGAGAQAVGIFGDEFFGAISAILTLLILVFSEIIPKTIGATYWKQLNPFAAYTIQVLVIALFPAVWLLERTTALLGSGESIDPDMSRLELEAMARISQTEGALQEGEGRILRNLLKLRDVHVDDVMTPRTVVVAFQQDMESQEVVAQYPTLPYSRIPIYNENTDDIQGFVLRQDIFHAFAEGEPQKTLAELQREIHVVPEAATIASVLDEFVRRQEHIFLVIDEYGGTAGIITLEDAIETLLGIEITDESDVVADLRKMAAQRYEKQRALLNVVGTDKIITAQPAEQPVENPSPDVDNPPVS